MVAKFVDVNDGRKVWAIVYVPECNHAQESHTCQFFFLFFYFPAIFAGPRFVEIQIFCYHCNLT